MYSNFKRRIGFFRYVLLLLFPLASAADNLKNIDVDITTHLGDAQSFRHNDGLSFLISLDQAAYIYVFYQSTDEQVYKLIPNQQQKNHHYNAGMFMPVPDMKAGYRFNIQPPFGEDRVWVFVSDNPDIHFNVVTQLHGLDQLEWSIPQIRDSIKNQSSIHFGAASLLIATQAM